MVNKDKTGNERQTRRRQLEKSWLERNNFSSWESLHTALVSGKIMLTVPDMVYWQCEKCGWANKPIWDICFGCKTRRHHE